MPTVETGGFRNDALGRVRDRQPCRSDRGQMTTIKENRRVAYCECGAQLVGGSELELFQAAERHVAHHHPQLLGALEREVVQQMAEDAGG